MARDVSDSVQSTGDSPIGAPSATVGPMPAKPPDPDLDRALARTLAEEAAAATKPFPVAKAHALAKQTIALLDAPSPHRQPTADTSEAPS